MSSRPLTHPPHRGVHRPSMFICGSDPADSVVVYDVNDAETISGVLLEDVSDWVQAIQGLPEESVPEPVAKAVQELHNAVCAWSEWLWHRSRSAE